VKLPIQLSRKYGENNALHVYIHFMVVLLSLIETLKILIKIACVLLDPKRERVMVWIQRRILEVKLRSHLSFPLQSS
jgi:hypothetical protein